MKYDKNAILNTAQRLRSKSSGLNSIQTKLSRISPQKCSSSFYTRRYSLVRRLKNVQSEIDSLSTDIISAAHKMSSDDIQNARYIRNFFNNRISKITFGQRLFDTGNTDLKRNGVFGSLLMFSKAGMNRRTVSSLGNASSGKIPWYQQIGNFFRGGATAIGNAVNNVKDGVYNGYNYLKGGAASLGNKVGEFGKNAWDSASNFFSGAGEWIGDRWSDFKDWGNAAKDYTWKSVTKFVLGDYDGENITALSFVGNLAAGFFGVDVPLDVRDLVYDVQHWGEGDNFGIYFALDCLALIPVIGVVKNIKYADDIVDGAKDLGKVVDTVVDAGKTGDNIVDIVDESKDLGKVVGDSNLLNEVGKFTDDTLENSYQAYVNRKIKQGQVPKNRLDWKKASDYWTKESPVARGNNFNKTVREMDIYDYHEIYLENGKRLDSYDPDAGEIISRKATDLDKINEETYRGYLSEFSQKYSQGTRIRSNAYPELDGQELKGQYILEIPANNANLRNIDYYKQIASEYNVILRFTEEM